MHWREAFQVETPEVSYPILEQRLKQYALPIWKKLEKRDRDGEYLYDFDDVLGGSVTNTSAWVRLMNTILRGIPESAWPPPNTVGEEETISILHISLVLSWGEEEEEVGLRMANLVFDNDDHTAWVVETRKRSGVYKNFDIGGS